MRSILRWFVVCIIQLICTCEFYGQSHLSSEIDRISNPQNKYVSDLFPEKVALPCVFDYCFSDGYVGISDARLDSVSAYNLAYLRALSMYSLQLVQGRGMSDFFNEEKNGSLSSNYEEFYELKAEANCPAMKVVKKITLQSGELLLVLNVDAEKQRTTDENLKSSIEFYYKETEFAGSRVSMNKIKICNELIKQNGCRIHSENTTCLLTNNRWVSQNSDIDGRKTANDKFKFFYVTDSCAKDTSGFEQPGTNTTDGLWFAFVNNIYPQIATLMKTKFMNVKQVGDNYKSKSVSLNRESGLLRFKILISSGVYFENKLYTKIKTEFLNSNP